jgi:hypothetical protein
MERGALTSYRLNTQIDQCYRTRILVSIMVTSIFRPCALAWL